jgi:hypothetical protein
VICAGEKDSQFVWRAKILGGNADGCENKGVAKKAIQKMLITRELKIDDLPNSLRVAVGKNEETGTVSAQA